MAISLSGQALCNVVAGTDCIFGVLDGPISKFFGGAATYTAGTSAPVLGSTTFSAALTDSNTNPRYTHSQASLPAGRRFRAWTDRDRHRLRGRDRDRDHQSIGSGRKLYRPFDGGEKIAPVDQPGSCLETIPSNVA